MIVSVTIGFRLSLLFLQQSDEGMVKTFWVEAAERILPIGS